MVITLIVGAVLLGGIIINILYTVKVKSSLENQVDTLKALEQSLLKIDIKIDSSDKNLKDEIQKNRVESTDVAQKNRQEMSETLKATTVSVENNIKKLNETMISMQKELLNIQNKNQKEMTDENRKNREENQKTMNAFGTLFEKNVKDLQKLFADKYEEMKTQQKEFNTSFSESNAKDRKEMNDVVKNLQTNFSENIKAFNELLRQNFSDFAKQQTEINKQTTERVKEINTSVEKQLVSIRDDNKKQLDEMRNTVDEKLQKTLNARLTQSFETVGKQLQAVQEGLGEMKNLATDVGGLKRVLSNVKMRGGIGEIQLSMLLEQILAPDQYEANVMTKKGSSDVVEFAVKLPGKDDSNSVVWLPIDAKFPKDVYENLQTACDVGEQIQIETAQKALENTIKKMAKDIGEKYIDPPNTTDFGIMFLPFEGIYAEVVRKAALLEELQNKYKIIVTGPTTLAAILNSLQIGFKTLAIQKRSSEVWRVLGAVKTEFNKFGDMMNKAHKHIQTGLNQMDTVMGTRTRAIKRTLRDIEALSEDETNLFFPVEATDDFEEEFE